MRRELFTVFMAVCLCVIIYPQFGMLAFATPHANFSVDVLLDYGNGTNIWSTCVLSTPGNDTVYNATQVAAATLNITWYGDDIFVDAINGVWNNWTSGYWWAVFVWNYSSSSWQTLDVACNKHQLSNNDMVAWYYDAHPWPPVPPPDPPVTQINVLLNYGNRTVNWYENVNVIGVATVFKATQAVAVLDYSWWGDDIFVDAINRVWNNWTTNYYWLYWYWNFTSESWNSGPVACNKYLLNNGDIIAWYYETDPWGPPSTIQPYGPEAEFTAIPDTALVGKSVKFDASSSLPGWNGTHEMPITEYRWDFGDGNETTTSTPIVYHSFSGPRIYYVTLTVYAPGATPKTDLTTRKVTVTAIPVGGYSLPIEGYATEKPLTPYLALVAILTAVFITIRHKKFRREYKIAK